MFPVTMRFLFTAGPLVAFHKELAVLDAAARRGFERDVRFLAAIYGRVLNYDQEEFLHSYNRAYSRIVMPKTTER